jgi:NAD(P)-dependent dehydrogenase (short-subunit alcohol dehydrogenase family)
MTDDPSSHNPAAEAIRPGRVAVITGAAGGIGFAAARQFFALGLKVALIDRDREALDRAVAALADTAPARKDELLGLVADVARYEQVELLRDQVRAAFGDVAVLMNNAATGRNPGKPWEDRAGWSALFDVNLGGVLNGVQAFVPEMLTQGRPGLVVNTGSKQGITLPPGNAAYNVAKAAVRAYTELLAHELRNVPGCGVSAHLLIPGWTHTGMTGRGEKPAAAWTPDQVVAFMLESVRRGDFYILCPDNDVTRPVDEKRIQWMAEDIIRNRPALSRWHPDYKDAFADFMRAGQVTG